MAETQEQNSTVTNNDDITAMTVKERIIRISNELRVEKEGRNTYSDYEYIKPDDLQNALKPLYLKYRIFAHFGVRKLKDGRNEAVLRVEDFGTDTGRQIYTMVSDDIQIKGANSAMNVAALRTYCNRYLLMTAFNISSNDDDLDNDRNQNGDGKVQKKPVQAKKSEEESAKAELIRLCQEKAKTDRQKVIDLITKYEASGTAAKVSGISNITALINELKTI